MFHTPAHKQLDPAAFPAQRVNNIGGITAEQATATRRNGPSLGEIVNRMGREKAAIREAYACRCSSCDTSPLAPSAVDIADEIANPRHAVYDHQTGRIVAGPYRSLRRARNKRDELDLEYGAVRFGVRNILA